MQHSSVLLDARELTMRGAGLYFGKAVIDRLSHTLTTARVSAINPKLTFF